MRRLILCASLGALSACGGGGASDIAPPGKVLIARTPAQLRWPDAAAYCSQLTAQNTGGWRLPTAGELAGYAQAGIEVGAGAVWTSDASGSGHLYISLNSKTGLTYEAADTSYFYVRCAHD